MSQCKGGKASASAALSALSAERKGMLEAAASLRLKVLAEMALTPPWQPVCC